MTSLILFFAGSLLVFLTLGKLDKKGKLKQLQNYLRKYPPH